MDTRPSRLGGYDQLYNSSYDDDEEWKKFFITATSETIPDTDIMHEWIFMNLRLYIHYQHHMIRFTQLPIAMCGYDHVSCFIIKIQEA